MGRAGITYHDVDSAITRIQQKGEHPTIDRIRDCIGMGSRTTIAKYVKQWRQNNPQPQNSTELTTALPADLVQIVHDLWERLHHHADARIEAADQAATEKLHAIEATLRTTQTDHEALQKTIHDLQKHTQAQDTQLQAQTIALQAFKTEKAIAQERQQQLERQLREAKATEEKWQKQLEHQETNFVHYQSSLQKLRDQELHEFKAVKQQYEKALHDFKARLSLAAEHAQQQALLLQQADSERTAQLLALKELKDQQKQWKRQDEEKSTALAALEAEHALRQQTDKKQHVQLQKQQATIVDLEKQLAVLRNESNRATREQQQAKSERDNLHQENQKLSQENERLKGQIDTYSQLCNETN